MICKRCKEDKPKIEFNSVIRYQRPVYDTFTEYCATCYWEQMFCSSSWLSCFERLLWRIQYTDSKTLAKFEPYTIEELTKPLLSWYSSSIEIKSI